MTLNEEFNLKNSITSYQIILTTEEDKEILTWILPNIVNYIIITIPNFKTPEEMIQYFRKISIDSDNETKNQLLITKNQEYIIFANFLGIDTCFVNNGLNDAVSYKTTYEVRNSKRVKKLNIK